MFISIYSRPPVPQRAQLEHQCLPQPIDLSTGKVSLYSVQKICFSIMQNKLTKTKKKEQKYHTYKSYLKWKHHLWVNSWGRIDEIWLLTHMLPGHGECENKHCQKITVFVIMHAQRCRPGCFRTGDFIFYLWPFNYDMKVLSSFTVTIKFCILIPQTFILCDMIQFTDVSWLVFSVNSL